MTKLKIRVEKWEKAISAQILEMDERFRGLPKKKFISKKIFHVNSSTYPQFYEENIYLRGDEKDRDFNIFSKGFSTNEERDAYHQRLYDALCDWAKNWEGWGETGNDNNVANMGWQPIETAPVDSCEEVLVWYTDKEGKVDCICIEDLYLYNSSDIKFHFESEYNDKIPKFWMPLLRMNLNPDINDTIWEFR